MKSDRTKSRVTGVLFLSAFLAYGVGTGLATGVIEAKDPVVEVALKRAQFITGTTLMLLNSIIVASIGLLLLPTLVRFNRAIAWLYLAARVCEATALAAGVMGLLSLVIGDSPVTEAAIMTAIEGNFFAYQAGMTLLSFGSLLLCALLYRYNLVPRFFAAWGFLGYTLLFTGVMLEIAGLPYGIILSIPGGLFEVAFGVWLIAKGLPNTRAVVSPNTAFPSI